MLLFFLILLHQISNGAKPFHIDHWPYDKDKTNQLRELLNTFSPQDSVPFDLLVDLVKNGANPNIKAISGRYTGKSWAEAESLYRWPHDALTVLLTHGAKIGDHEFIKMCMLGRYEQVKMLLDHRMYPTPQYMWNFCTPLYAAVCMYNVEIVELLLKKGFHSDIDTFSGLFGETTINRARIFKNYLRKVCKKSPTQFNLEQKNKCYAIIELLEKYRKVYKVTGNTPL